MNKQKKKDKIFINKNAGDVTKGIEMFNKSMTFNTQSSAQEELNQRVANNDISSEETYDILNRISELRDEAEKEDDHNNPIGAIKLHKEADKLQETKTKKTTIRECLNKMDLQASDNGFRGITLVDLYEACTLTKDDKNHLIKMLQTTDDAEKVREFLSNKCEFEDIPEDDIDAEVQLECTKSDWEKLNDLDEGYQQGDEQVLDPDSEEYKKFEKIADLLNEANIIYTSGRHKGERAYFYVDDVYLDFGSDWKWTTIVREDNVQVLSPADWLSIINEESTPEEIVNKIVTKDYSGVQFANDLDEGYKKGDKKELDPDSENYKKFEKIVGLLNDANIIYTSGQHKGERAHFYVGNTYLDFGQGTKWTTIIRDDNVQILSLPDWLSIINDRETPEEIVNELVTDKYSGLQFANESQLGEAISNDESKSIKECMNWTNGEEEILYVIKDSHGNQLSKPNADDSELWDRVASMEARGRRGLRVVVYTGKKESLAEDKGQPRSNRYTTYFNRIKRAIEKGDEETLKRTKEAIMYAPAKELKNSEAAELMDMIKNRKINEAFDVDKVAKRIARYNEFDNGYVLHNYERMTSAEAEEKARLASIEYPDDIFYVSYDNIMEPCSDIKWKNGKKLSEASYGGAFDIEDDQYFTKEELVEFGEDVVDNLNSLAYSKAELESIFIENNIIEITITWDGNEITVNQPIDMRRIRKPKDLDKYRVRVISKMKPELEELGFDFGPHLGDYELSESEEDHKEAEWKRLLTKSVNDSDGFLTDYSMWYNDGEKRWVFIFGDSDIYDPTNTDPDWETEDPEEARQWFLDYKGFEDDEDLDLDENKPMNEAREYYILPVENLIGSERRELGYYDLEMIGRKGLVTYIEGTYPDLSDYARNVLDFDLEEDDPMLTLSSEWDEELDEDVVKQGNKWVNKGKEGTHGTFKTKKDALKQTRAMYAKGYKG